MSVCFWISSNIAPGGHVSLGAQVLAQALPPRPDVHDHGRLPPLGGDAREHQAPIQQPHDRPR